MIIVFKFMHSYTGVHIILGPLRGTHACLSNITWKAALWKLIDCWAVFFFSWKMVRSATVKGKMWWWGLIEIQRSWTIPRDQFLMWVMLQILAWFCVLITSGQASVSSNASLFQFDKKLKKTVCCFCMTSRLKQISYKSSSLYSQWH